MAAQSTEISKWQQLSNEKEEEVNDLLQDVQQLKEEIEAKEDENMG